MTQKLENLRLEDFLCHIEESLNRIFTYTKHLSERDFLSNSMAQDAVVRNLEIVGEAARHVLDQYKHLVAQEDQAALRNAYRMRNVLVHGYFGVEQETVWDTIQKDLPLLAEQIRRMTDVYDKTMAERREASGTEEGQIAPSSADNKT